MTDGHGSWSFLVDDCCVKCQGPQVRSRVRTTCGPSYLISTTILPSWGKLLCQLFLTIFCVEVVLFVVVDFFGGFRGA
jgi:hypothetical protein